VGGGNEMDEPMSREERKRELMNMGSFSTQETELANGEKLVETITEELNFLKDQEKNLTSENQAMSTELSDVKLQLQKIEYESKESAINVESLKETNQDLHTELEELKKSLEAVRSAQKVNVDEEKIKRKADKMAEMMAGFDPSVRLTIWTFQ
jgi:kinesin family member 5